MDRDRRSIPRRTLLAAGASSAGFLSGCFDADDASMTGTDGGQGDDTAQPTDPSSFDGLETGWLNGTVHLTDEDDVADVVDSYGDDTKYVLHGGSYEFSVELNDYSNVVFEGAGRGTRVACPDDETVFHLSGECENIVIRDLHVDLRGHSIDTEERAVYAVPGNLGRPSGITVENVSVIDDGVGGTHFHFSGGERVTLRDCRSESNRTYGAYFWHCDGVTIDSFQSRESTWNDIAVYGDSANVSIQNCICRDGASGHSPIACSTANHVSIVGNTIENIPGDREGGIEVEYKSRGQDDTSHHVTVCGNVVEDCEWGIFTHNRDGGGADDPHNVVFANNTVSGCDVGCYLDSGDAILVTGNDLLDNDVPFSATTGVGYETTDNIGHDIFAQ